MSCIKGILKIVAILFIGNLGLGFSPVQAEEAMNYPNYIVYNWAIIQKEQTINIYNTGKLDSSILKDNSIIKYTYDSNGNLINKNKMTSSSEPYKVSFSSLSYDIYLKGVPDNVSQVRFPTWTLNKGQDDIEWINGEKVSEGIWKGTIQFSKHGNELGTYITHMYVDNDSKGISVQVVSTTSVAGPQNAKLSAGYYEVTAKGVGANIEQVKFPTWTEKNGQDDLVNPWIVGERISRDTWRIKVPFSEHNFETGLYNTHVYAFDKYGNVGGIGSFSTNVSGGIGGASNSDLSGVSYDVFIYGVDDNVVKVQFPTWTDSGGSDDLEWINGVKVAKGVWRGTVIYSKHNNETGKYFTDIYTDGKYSGGTTFEVKNESKVTVPAEVALSKGSYEVFVEGVPSNINEVKFPTWTEANGHDDLEIPWVQGERINQTTWKVKIPFSKHNNETGKYITHIYSVDSYGNQYGFRSVQVNVK